MELSFDLMREIFFASSHVNKPEFALHGIFNYLYRSVFASIHLLAKENRQAVVDSCFS